MAQELSARVAEFIRTYIESLEELEILLLLHKSPHLDWTVDSVYATIRSNPESIRERLKGLVAKGLIEIIRGDPEHFIYRVIDQNLDGTLQSLALAYKERRVTVVELIFAKPPSPIQGFANAFRIRKDPKDG